MRLIYSVRAEHDLEKLSDWIAIDNEPRAFSFVEELRSICRKLLDVPEGYPEAPEFGAGIRKRAYGNYPILYRFQRNHVLVVSVRHAARQR